MNINSIFAKYVLAQTGSDTFLVYENFTFYEYNERTRKEIFIGKIDVSFKKQILGRIRLTNRLLRLEPRATVKWNDGKYVISVLHNIYIVDTIKKRVERLNVERQGFSDPLNFCNANGSIFWGDYGNNASRDAVNIYMLSPNGEVSIPYSFAPGKIRHIHNVIFDKTNECFWIFAGDNEKTAGIYKSSIDWTEVVPYKIGQQKYRAVVGFPCNSGLIYATDSVEKVNHIRCINSEGDESILCQINGSCIYGCETKNHYIFSTTVEPSENGKKKLGINNSLGGGILSNEVEVVAVNKSTMQPNVVARFVKDAFPMPLFQYGRVKFPSGQELNSDNIIGNVVACKRYDGKAVKISL